MKITETCLNGIYQIDNKKLEDNRGIFVKTFHADIFTKKNIEIDFKESFYSTSKKNVLRGMHFQLSPYDHAKLVYVTHGEILDVVVDIRKESATFGQHYSTILSSKNSKSVYISKGFAHGFLTLSNLATVVYLTTTVHSPEFDSGILWNSFNFNWNIKSPVMSERDKSFLNLDVFI